MLHPNGGAVWPGMALFVSIRLPACFHYHLGRFVWLEAHRATVASRDCCLLDPLRGNFRTHLELASSVFYIIPCEVVASCIAERQFFVLVLPGDVDL